jgi:isocitrate dehydrogenase
MYWAQMLASQDENPGLKDRFTKITEALEKNETEITGELLAAQGRSQEIGGYYHPDLALCEKAMRPSAKFNSIIDSIGQ